MKQALTLDQQRAEYAWCAAKRAEEKRLIEEYAILAKSTASLVMGSGLMQTLAFLKAKSKGCESAHHILLDDLCKWLGCVFGNAPGVDSKHFRGEREAQFEPVMRALYQLPTGAYMRANREIMELFRWLRQFADACKSMKSSEMKSSERSSP